MPVLKVALLLLVMAAAALAQPAQLLVLADDVPAGLDYDGPSAAAAASQAGYLNMMEPLLYYPDGRYLNDPGEDGVRRLDVSKFEPRLAERWEFDPPNLTWTLHLRRGVKSCAGNEFTADDVLYSFARAKSVSGAVPIGWFLASVAGVKGFTRDVFKPGADKALGDAVEKLDDYTIRIRQTAANRLFLTALAAYGAAPFDSKAMRAHATPADPWSHNWANTADAAAFGPYCLERWVRNDEFVLRANPGYYRGPPSIGRVVIKRVPQGADRAQDMKAGRGDLTQRLTPREFASLRTAPNVTVAGLYGNETLFLNLNDRTPPFDNPALRQAIAFAMPYQQVAAIGYAGAARRWEGHFPRAFNGAVQPDTQYTTDPARAKQLLAEAGYPSGRGLEAYAANFRLAYAAEREGTLRPIAAAIQSALRDAGFPIELDPLPQAQFSDRRLVKKNLPMSLSDTDRSAIPDVVYATMLFFVSPSEGGVNNMANYSNPAVDRLFALARNEMDDAAQPGLLRDIQNTLQRELAWIPIVETKTEWAFRSTLRGITWHPDNALRFYDLSFATVP